MRFSRRQVALMALLFLVALLNYVDRQVLSILAPLLRQEIGLSQSDYALAVNAFLAAYALMYVGSGVVLDRLGSRAGLAFFLAGWSLVSAAHAGIRGLADLAALRFLLGLFEPGGWTGAVKTISERFTPVQRGLAAGVFTCGASVATFLTPPLVVFLSVHYGWRLAFLVPSLAGFLWLPLWLAATRERVAPAAVPRLSWKETWPLLRQRRVLAYVLVRFFGDSSGYFFLFWIPDYLTSVKQFSFVMLGTLAWIPYLAYDAGPVTGGWLASRLAASGWNPVRARKILMSAAAVIVSTGAGSLFVMRPWAVLSILAVSAFGVGIWAGNLHGLAADAFPPRGVGTAYGLAGSAGAIGGLLFNSLAGHWSANAQYGLVFLAFLLLEPLGAAALWLWMREGDPVAA